MMMRKTLLAMALITTAGVASLGVQAAAPTGAGNPPMPVPPGAQYGQPPLAMPLPPFPGPHGGPDGHGDGFCHGNALFCASMISENPADSLQKLNSILPPTAKGVHYQVRVAVVAIPDHGPRAADDHGGKPAPKPGQSVPQP